MKRYLVVLLLLPSILVAQSNSDTIRFEIIKATVHFYATDTNINKESNLDSECKALDYNCLKTFAVSNKLTGVDKRIDGWLKEPYKQSADLQKLQEMIVNDLTQKGYRRQMSSFPGYTDKLKALLTLVQKSTPAGGGTIQTSTFSDSAKIADLIDAALKKQTGNALGLGLFTWIALLAGVVGLGLAGWLYAKLGKVQQEFDKKMAVAKDEAAKQQNALTDIHHLLQQGSNNASSNLSELQQQLNAVKGELQKLQQNTQEARATLQPTIKSNIPVTETTTIVYAKLADLPNGGFRTADIKKEQNGEQVYEISITGQSATYVISDDRAVQGYALSDGPNYILADACKMLNSPPHNNCRILTKKEGVLRKTVDGWMIEQKAEIQFQ
jgi:hypothetical protein